MQKLTDTELQRIQFIKKDALEIASTLGELQYQKVSIDLLIEEEKQKIKELKKSETQLFEELRQKYGNVNINIETGEFQ
jgi:coproporphyrinogen III oxidase-like Fe-S oxidoreductase